MKEVDLDVANAGYPIDLPGLTAVACRATRPCVAVDGTGNAYVGS